MKSQVGEQFSEFFETWIHQLDDYLKLLLIESNDGSFSEAEKESLVSKLTAHHQEFYTVKWKSAHEDVLAFYCPIWLTKLEIAYSWLTGWKPSMMFRLVESMRSTRVSGPDLSELTEEQVRKMEKLRAKIKVEEFKVEMEMERQQMAIADRNVVDLVRMVNRVKNGQLVVGQVDGVVRVALEGLLVGLEKVLKSADCVRLKILKEILDVLNPSQSINFLAGTSMAQIQLRQWGQKRDTQNGPSPTHNTVVLQDMFF